MTGCLRSFDEHDNLTRDRAALGRKLDPKDIWSRSRRRLVPRGGEAGAVRLGTGRDRVRSEADRRLGNGVIPF